MCVVGLPGGACFQALAYGAAALSRFPLARAVGRSSLKARASRYCWMAVMSCCTPTFAVVYALASATGLFS